MVKKAKDKKTGKIVEYMAFTPEDIPEIEKWSNAKFTFDEKKQLFYLTKDAAPYDWVVEKFDYIAKSEDGSLGVLSPELFLGSFKKFEEDDVIDAKLAENPEMRAQIENAVADYQAQAKVKAQKEFSLIPELEELLRYFEDAQHIILDNDPEKEQMRKDAATDALYNFCRGLVIGAKIARQ